MARKSKPKETAVKSKFPPTALEKLNSSGLTELDAKKLSIEYLPSSAVFALSDSFRVNDALKINYTPPVQKALKTNFYRLRYLSNTAPTKGFSAITSAKGYRYAQPPNSLPEAYYPSNTDWADILNNVDKPIIITEGEFKAAKACKEGFPTIGLGGVWNWRALAKGVEWLPSLDWVLWQTRNVYIIFDSDITQNENVQNALAKLIEALDERGAICWVVVLPCAEDGSKMGLDDFLCQKVKDNAAELKTLLAKAGNFGLSKKLWALNEKYLCVGALGCVVSLKDPSMKFTINNFKALIATEKYTYPITVEDKNGELQTKYKTTPVGLEWLQWPLRNYVDKFVYAPGKGKYKTLENGVRTYNLWRGWGVPQQKGNVKPFLNLVNHIFKGAEKEHIDWFLQWCAYPIQNPGAKLYTTVILHGLEHGTGKSLIGELLTDLYGEHGTAIAPTDFFKTHNGWAECKQFIFIEEADSSNKRALNQFLKRILTQKTVRVNQKYIPDYPVDDCMNYFFCANPPDTFYIEDNDRRFFIHEITVGPRPLEFYEEIRRWRENGGLSHLLDFFMTLDLSNFSPRAAAPRTAARTKMIQLGYTDLEEWVRDLLADPDAILKKSHLKNTDKIDIYTAKDLYLAFDPEQNSKDMSPTDLARALANAGAQLANRNKKVHIKGEIPKRYWIVRNVDKWKDCEHPEILKHLEGAEQNPKKTTKKKY